MGETRIGLSEEKIREMMELVKTSIKLTPKQRFEILSEAQEVAMKAHGRRSLAEIEKLSEKAEKVAREI